MGGEINNEGIGLDEGGEAVWWEERLTTKGLDWIREERLFGWREGIEGEGGGRWSWYEVLVTHGRRSGRGKLV